ncbi:Protein phosphatase 1 regulatory subunit 12C, partial [Orchesella cincta]
MVFGSVKKLTVDLKLKIVLNHDHPPYLTKSVESFVPPTRDEESETQRKAHAKRVRETRRSTQGVTLEELKSAEQYVKNSQSGVSNASGSGTTNSVPVSSSSSRKEQEELGVERRPSWRLRVDEQDRSKFSLEDTRGTTSAASGSPSSVSGPVPTSRSAAGYHEIPYGLAQRNPALRSKLGKGMVVDPTQLQSVTSAPQGKPPLPPGEESGTSAAGPQQQDEERDVKNSGGAQGAILRKKKTKRRSTGVVQFNTD